MSDDNGQPLEPVDLTRPPDPNYVRTDAEPLNEEAETNTREAYDKQQDPPWTPLPLDVARDWLKANEEGVLEVVFPTVYEEDRSDKLKDLATMQATAVISHQRYSEQSAKEMGFEEYDYQDELQQIEREKAVLPLDIVSATDELLINRSANGAGKPGGSSAPFGGEPGRRDELGGAATQDFRRDQRTMAPRESARQPRLWHMVAKQRASLLESARTLRQAKEAAGQTLMPGEVLYMEDGGPKRCDRCIMWVADTNRCTIHGPNVEVRPDMVCGLYVNGPPTTSRESATFPYVTQQESMLGTGNTSCGNCFYGSGRPRCAHPALSGFPIDNVGGCCNAWTDRPAMAAAPMAPVESARQAREAFAVPTIVEPKVIIHEQRSTPEAVAIFQRLTEAVDRLGEIVIRGENAPVQAAKATAEVLLRLTEAVGRLGQPPEVHVAPPVVNVQPPVVKVEVKVPPAVAMIREVERDEETGLITRITERPAEDQE